MSRGGMSPEEFTRFLTAIGNYERWDNSFWVPFATEWERWENTTAAFNPLASTDDSLPGTTFNSDGVKSYRSFDDGVQATIRTLDPGSYYSQFVDYYKTIREAIRLRSIDSAGRSAVEAELRKWNTTGFANVVASGWSPSVADTTPTLPVPLTVEELNAALQKRFAISRLADDPELWKVERAWGLLRNANLL